MHLRWLNRVGAVLCVAALAGCAAVPPATEVRLSYESDPPGATLYEGSLNLGVAPVTRTYAATPGSNTVRTPEVTAVWPSGARTPYYTLLPVGADRVATLERPTAAPGLQTDLAHAKQLATEQQRATQREQDAIARDMKRNSVRCKEQQAKGNLATNDC